MKLLLPFALLLVVAVATIAEKQELVSFHLEDSGIESDSDCAKSRRCIKSKCQFMNLEKLLGEGEKSALKGKVPDEAAAAFGRLKKLADGTVDNSCTVWAKGDNGGHTLKAPKPFSGVHPWHTNNLVFGNTCNPITKTSDVRGIEFEVNQLDMQERYKIIGLGRKTRDQRGENPKTNPEVGVISYGVYFKKCNCHDSDEGVAIMSIYDRNYNPANVKKALTDLSSAVKTGDAEKIKKAKEESTFLLGGEEAQMDGLFQYQQHFRMEHHHRIRNCYHHHYRRHYRCDHHWNTKRSMPVWDYCGKAEYHELSEPKRTFCGRVFNGDKVAVRVNPENEKFEVFVNGQIRYRSPEKVIYPAEGYIPAASFSTPDGEVINTEWSGEDTKITLDKKREKSTCYPRVISNDGDGMDYAHTLTTDKNGVGLGKERCDIATRLSVQENTGQVLDKLRKTFKSQDAQRAINNVDMGFENYDYFEESNGKIFCRIFNEEGSFNLLKGSSSNLLQKQSTAKTRNKGSCIAAFADFSPIPNEEKGVTNGMEIGNEDFWELYNDGYLTEHMTLYPKGKDGKPWPAEKLSISVKPTGANFKFLAHYNCNDDNDLCECGTQFRVVANVLGKNVTEYNVMVDQNSVTYCDCKGVGNCGQRFGCSRSLLASKTLRTGRS